MIDIDKFNEPYPRPVLYKSTIGSDRLLICAGDSWTWGDSLGKINTAPPAAPPPPGSNNLPLPDDFEWRITHIYGALLASKLKIDFVNLGIPGRSNLEIIDTLYQKVVPAYHKHYKKITVLFTLTELCREMELSLASADQITNFNGINDFLMQFERLTFERIMSYQRQYPGIEIRVARNFTYTFAENLSILEHRHLNKTWIDVIADYTKQSDYPKSIRVLSQIGMEPLIQYIKKNKTQFQLHKPEFVDMLTDSLAATTWLEKSPCNYKKATKHPTEKGHELWADYIYNTCKDIL